uniref:Receptor ligand binding region domain-containing protein n=1 Tax=Varanus komodoensis TaxID=61221 RepID=A0A8D2LPK3_VARKO
MIFVRLHPFFLTGNEIHCRILMSKFPCPKTSPTTKSHFLCSVITKFYQQILALVFAIKEINENPKILPNITLGFHIYDSYSDPKMTYRTSLDMLFKSHQMVPNYQCGTQQKLMGVIGGLSADISACMADILGPYKIPQVRCQEDVVNPTTSSPKQHIQPLAGIGQSQNEGIVQLLLHFHWKWIGLITMDDEHGERFLQTMEPMLSQNAICSEFTERIQANWQFFEIVNITKSHLHIFTETKARAVVIHGESTNILRLAAAILITMVFPLTDHSYGETIPAGKVWITTAQIEFTLFIVQKAFDMQMFHGTLSFTIHSNQPPGFQNFLDMIHPSGSKADGFITDFWEQAFGCFMSNSEAPRDINEIRFNEHGELVGGFEITSLVTFPNNSYARVKVGSLNPHAPPSKQFSLNEIRMEWPRDLAQVGK